MDIPVRIREDLQGLIKTFRGIREIWLFGSQANNEAGPDSDWDLFVLADTEMLTRLRSSPGFRECSLEKRLDLFVSAGDYTFVCPWPERSKREFLDLCEMGWEPIGSGVAEYESDKLTPTGGPRRVKAHRIWKRQNGSPETSSIMDRPAPAWEPEEMRPEDFGPYGRRFLGLE